VGIGIGAVIHGWVPEGFFVEYAGPDNPLAVPVAVGLGIPLYSNAAGILPLVEALYATGCRKGWSVNLAVAAVAVFFGFGVMSLAGLGAATLYIPLFYYTGTPLPEAISTGLLLNVVALGITTPSHLRAKTVNLRLGIPILVAATALAPLGAGVSHAVERNLLLGLFAGFLVVSGALMLFYRRPERTWVVSRPVEIGAGTAVGGGVGFLAGLLGVGGGVFVLPVLHGIGLDSKTATGTTALVALASSISGFASRATLGSLDVTFAVVTATAAAAGVLVASRFATTRLTAGGLKKVVAIILWVIAVKMIWDVLT